MVPGQARPAARDSPGAGTARELARKKVGPGQRPVGERLLSGRSPGLPVLLLVSGNSSLSVSVPVTRIAPCGLEASEGGRGRPEGLDRRGRRLEMVVIEPVPARHW